jgi:two-component system CheB/CheR fusion protein
MPSDQSAETIPMVVGIGASAGGLAALRKFLDHVPHDSGIAFVVVVHLSPNHESHLAALLQPSVRFPVQQVNKTTVLQPNNVYVIPPNANLDAIDSHLRLSKLEENRKERAPIDHFFRTLATAHDGSSIAVVLTGTGSDGTLGIKDVKASGGLVIVQDPAEAEFDGMPQSAISTGMVDFILPLDQIPATIIRYTQTKPLVPSLKSKDEAPPEERELLQKIYAQMQTRTNRDFSRYKQATVLRRIARRMQVNYIENIGAYLELLRERPEEVHALADELLITVTRFFRDTEVFEKLEHEIIPELFERKRGSDSIRAWSIGCATGEEAYSLAMLLVEAAARYDVQPVIQVFATDLHAHSLAKAREGIYPGDIAIDVKEERLKRFFQKENGAYRVRKELRELVIFAPHNILSDPPYSRIDLISCRNLLIYLERAVQHDLIELFHHALNPDGVLLLGSAESLESADLFRLGDKRLCYFFKRNVPSRELRLPVFPLTRSRFVADVHPPREHTPTRAAYATLHRELLDRYAPPSILVSPDNLIVNLSSNAGHYMLHPDGEPTSNIFRVVREELQLELQTALHQAREQHKDIETGPIPVRVNGGTHLVVLHVVPVLDREREGFALVVFEEQKPGHVPEAALPEVSQSSNRTHELEAELARARQQMKALIKDHERKSEEMRSASEEMQSTNEELRSTMEELETSKEELQSINEELQTVNQQNRHKVEELAQLSTDLQNHMAATDIATLFLDRELRVLRFTPKLGELFNVRVIDHGRPISDLTNRLGYSELDEDAKAVIKRLVPVERELQDKGGKWFLVRILPYRSSQDRIDGVVITFVDIHRRKLAEEQIRTEKRYAEIIIETLHEPLLILTFDFRVQTANPSFYRHFQLHPENTIGQHIYDLDGGHWNIPEMRTLLQRVSTEKIAVEDVEVEHTFQRIGRKVVLISARILAEFQLILMGIRDLTEKKRSENDLLRAERDLQAANDAKDMFLATLSHEMRTPLNAITGWINILRMGKCDQATLSEGLDVIERNTSAQVKLIEDVLDVSRIVSGKLRLEIAECDLIETITESIDAVRPAAEARGITLHAHLDPAARHVFCDGGRMQQVVWNLLTNAIKFSADGGKVDVTLSRDQSAAQISVSDNGQGISPELLPHVFDRFRQADNSTRRRFGGLGLGLSIVKQLVELHGGTVEARSDGEGHGSTFIFRLPIKAVAARARCEDAPSSIGVEGAARASHSLPQPVRLDGVHVLVVDDEADARRMLGKVLEGAGAHVTSAASASAALAILERAAPAEVPDVLVSDVGMPNRMAMTSSAKCGAAAIIPKHCRR